jgi:phosphatidylinositol-3,4,5-trisphosphate 3-phosphatase/dual-specificity protein phosphatase PTEN
MQNPEFLKVFEAFLEDNEYERVTNFLVDVIEYRKVRHEPTKRTAAQEIFKRHILQTSGSCVKCPAEVVATIQDRLEKGDLSKDLFDDAYTIVCSRCESGDFRRFAQHSSYQDMLPDSVQEKLVAEELEKEKGWINEHSYQSLHVDVISGLDIIARDSSKPDAFCIVSVGSKAYKTEMMKNTQLPAWETHFELPVNSTSLFVKITVSNKDRSSSLGQIVVYLVDIEPPFLPDWYILAPDEEMGDDEEVRGELHLRFRFSNQQPEEQKQALLVDSSTSAIGEFVRSKVSKKKKRFDADGFNLDLSYITDHLIAMGFPSEGLEGAYRNNMKDVQKFFKTRHPEHYWIYNLCAERAYPPDRFEDRVTRYGFEDHNPCPFQILLPVCDDVHNYLTQHPQNVCCIHCKAGKGRTGLVISAYLLYAGVYSTAEEALIFFGNQRTKNGKGVTIPSQKRYVKYMEQYLKGVKDPSYGLVPENNYVFLRRFFLYNPPPAAKASSINIKVLSDNYAFNSKNSNVVGNNVQDRDEDCAVFEFRPSCNVPLNGDIKFVLSYGTLFRTEKLFHFWFNTRFVINNELILVKSEIDKAVKDTKHQVFHENLRVRMEFEQIDEKTFPVDKTEKDFMQALVGSGSPKAYSFGEKNAKAMNRGDDVDEKDDDPGSVLSSTSPVGGINIPKKGASASSSANKTPTSRKRFGSVVTRT